MLTFKYSIEIIVILMTLIYNNANADIDKKMNKNVESMIEKKWDSENGYIIFCLCMGRLGNQLAHLVGSLFFSRSLGRRVVLPDIKTGARYFRFEEIFNVTEMAKFVNVTTPDVFNAMANKTWTRRTGLCLGGKECSFTKDPTSLSFWRTMGNIEFQETEVIPFYYEEIHMWNSRYPATQHPVIALRGAPSRFPVPEVALSSFDALRFNDVVVSKAKRYMKNTFSDRRLLAVHLRNGADWEIACSHIKPDVDEYMSSAQCSRTQVTRKSCFPSDHDVLRLIVSTVKKHSLEAVYIATDKRPLIAEIKSKLPDVMVVHRDPDSPLDDMVVLTLADYFIGNCVSSFSAFITRMRQQLQLKSYHFSFSEN